MAAILNSLFDQARSAGGLPATIRLATLSRMSSIDAKNSPDSPELVNALKKHLDTVLSEFGTKKGTSDIEKTIESKDSDKDTIRKLRNYIQLFADITSTQSFYNETVEMTANRITPAISDAIGVDRASIWLYDDNQSSIVCLDLYQKSLNNHSKGVVLGKTDFPNYFSAISSSRTLSAEDAHTHPGTSEFSEVYLKPLGINSLLDVPIFANGKIAGVVCHEHTGPKRKWTMDEENFAYLMGNLVGFSIERSLKKG